MYFIHLPHVQEGVCPRRNVPSQHANHTEPAGRVKQVSKTVCSDMTGATLLRLHGEVQAALGQCVGYLPAEIVIDRQHAQRRLELIARPEQLDRFVDVLDRPWARRLIDSRDGSTGGSFLLNDLQRAHVVGRKVRHVVGSSV